MMLKVKDAAQRISVSIGTIYALCQSGQLAHSRIGIGRGTIRINEQDLAAYLDRTKAEDLPAHSNREAVGKQFSELDAEKLRQAWETPRPA